jgi:hypothetical protein
MYTETDVFSTQGVSHFLATKFSVPLLAQLHPAVDPQEPSHLALTTESHSQAVFHPPVPESVPIVESYLVDPTGNSVGQLVSLLSW